ncbi:hypothetical protein [Pseudomonas sp.]|uniref:hypothetical protein n=1 Tax=Pseudomonas sp. TaxID=306 RepID=UPI00290A0E36|nr:hypothetical protein [Pseudomonas sp.]MDU4254513.1 hypothetical protein [Pseudomonas sp.]
MALKVYGGHTFKGGRQARTIIAAKSMKEAAEAIGTTLTEMRAYWSVSGNPKELEIALAQPGVVLYERVERSGDFQPINQDKPCAR